MGCPICKGFVHQVCNAPGCKTPQRSVFGSFDDISKTAPQKWSKLEPAPVPLCDICLKPAVWAHPQGGLRCENCPKPNK